MSVNGTDRKFRGADEIHMTSNMPASGSTLPCHFDGTWTCASDIKLQTAMRRQRWAPPHFLQMLTGATPLPRSACAPGLGVTLKIPAVLKIRGYRRRLFGSAFAAPPPAATNGRLASGCCNSSAGAVPNPPSALLRSSSSRSQFLADVTGCPNATQPEPFNRQRPLSKTPEGELASHLWDLPRLWLKGGELPRFSHQSMAHP